MAEEIVYEGKSLEQLEQEITCAVCQEHYTKPKVLPCLHYYCKECILKLARRTASNQPFSCPECRQKTSLPEGGVEELKTAFFVNRFQSHLSVMKRVHGKVEVKCEECTDSGNKAQAFCRQCAVFICKECARQHKRMKSFASHQVVSLEDLRQGTAREIAVKEPPTKKCLTHEEPLAIYCFDCKSLICRDCTVTVHKEHKFEFSKVAAPDTKEKLLENLSPLRAAAVALSGAVTDIQTTKQEVEAQGNSVANTIHTSFNQLQLLLDKHKQQLLHQAANQVQQKIDKLTAQEKSLSVATAEVQSIVDYTERFVGHCSDNEVMSMHTEIRRRIQQEVGEHSKSGRSLEPVEEADMGVEVRWDEALQELCQSKAKITRLALDPAQCTVKGEGTHTAEVNQTAEMTLTTKLTNKKTTRRRAVVVSELKSLYDGSVVKCEVDLSGPGEYRVQYTPTVRGRHELTVSVGGQQVAGNPFPVSVSISPTLLGKPGIVWKGIELPTGITTNSVGEVIVAEYRRDIVKIDKEGKKTVLVEHSKTKLDMLSSIATDKEDMIYCTSEDSNKILRCGKNGGNVQVHEVKQVQGPGYRGVAVVGDEVMVCEDNNRGTILVYDREVKYVRRIEQGGMGAFHNISADPQGNLYVTDCDNDCIRVFSNDGVLLQSFGCDDDGVKKLNKPCGVCVSGHYVYVINSGGHSVSVFTTEGDYVTSFGQYGNQKGQFRFPWDVCVDVDNFIYIADGNNNRVQGF